jgi:hypothetical protein
MKPTLDEFIAAYGPHRYPSNLYVRQRGFKHLYVRMNPRWWNNVWQDPTLDLANFEVRQPGKGVFTALVADLRQRYPALTLYVESVLNPRFQTKLIALGFTRTEGNSFILLPQTKRCPTCHGDKVIMSSTGDPKHPLQAVACPMCTQ